MGFANGVFSVYAIAHLSHNHEFRRVGGLKTGCHLFGSHRHTIELMVQLGQRHPIAQLNCADTKRFCHYIYRINVQNSTAR